MALVKWSAGDIISAREANDFGIRKGSESDIAGIPSADAEDGSILYNTTSQCPQVYITASADERGSLLCYIGADSNEVTQTGVTPLEVKSLSYIKDVDGFKGQFLRIIAELKSSDASDFAHLRVRTDGGGGDDLDLTTNSTTEVILTGTIDISGKSLGRHTIEFFIDDGTGDTVTQRELEVWGL